jgi:enamine deaminase RidA (YjgF/YER057c/UK114 family)
VKKTMANTHVNPSTLFSLPEFSQIVISAPGRIAFIAGQGAFDHNFNLAGSGDLYTQTIAAFKNLQRALEAAGTSVANILSTNMYIVNLDEEKTEIFVKAMKESLEGQGFPANASTLLGVTRLGHPEMLVEISATASVPDD